MKTKSVSNFDQIAANTMRKYDDICGSSKSGIHSMALRHVEGFELTDSAGLHSGLRTRLPCFAVTLWILNSPKDFCVEILISLQGHY